MSSNYQGMCQFFKKSVKGETLVTRVIRWTSAGASITIGVLILILWLVAANDKGSQEGTLYKCKGCFQIHHDYLNDVKSDLNDWKKTHGDVYPLLIAFGVICGIFWIGTGIVGFIAKNELLFKIYIAAAAATYLLHATIFPIIVTQYAYYGGCHSLCYTADDWETKHKYISYDMFWGASLVCFLGGAYTIVGAIYLFATGEKSVTAQPSQLTLIS